MLLSIYHQNLRGLKHKIDKLACSFIAKELHLCFICITEHYLMEQKLLLLSHESCHLVSNFSHKNSTGGGVCIYVRCDMIKNTSKKISHICTDKILEACAAQIFIEKFSITIVCICRATSADFDHFSNLCDLTLKYLHSLHMELVICVVILISVIWMILFVHRK